MIALRLLFVHGCGTTIIPPLGSPANEDSGASIEVFLKTSTSVSATFADFAPALAACRNATLPPESEPYTTAIRLIAGSSSRRTSTHLLPRLGSDAWKPV